MVYVNPKTEGDRVGNGTLWGWGVGSRGKGASGAHKVPYLIQGLVRCAPPSSSTVPTPTKSSGVVFPNCSEFTKCMESLPGHSPPPRGGVQLVGGEGQESSLPWGGRFSDWMQLTRGAGEPVPRKWLLTEGEAQSSALPLSLLGRYEKQRAVCVGGCMCGGGVYVSFCWQSAGILVLVFSAQLCNPLSFLRSPPAPQLGWLCP